MRAKLLRALMFLAYPQRLWISVWTKASPERSKPHGRALVPVLFKKWSPKNFFSIKHL